LREYKNYFEKIVSLECNINYHRTKVKKNSYTEKLLYTPCQQLYWILHIITDVIFFFQLMKYIMVS